MTAIEIDDDGESNFLLSTPPAAARWFAARDAIAQLIKSSSKRVDTILSFLACCASALNFGSSVCQGKYLYDSML